MFNRIVLSLIVAFFLAIIGGGAELSRAQADCQTPAPSDAQHFSGETSTVTEPFTVESGILTVTGSHQGDANFIVIAYSETGPEAYLFNEIGPYTGQTALQVEPGTKLILDVQANGPWEISIESAF